MSIEVKQLIVKSTLVSDARDDDRRDSAIDVERLKQQVIDECRELIEQSLEELQER
jgi:hypothetical protein